MPPPPTQGNDEVADALFDSSVRAPYFLVAPRMAANGAASSLAECDE